MERAQRQISLTDRQREVLRLIERGHTNGEIAEMLGISLQGAKWHVRELLGKFGVDSREELAEAWAQRRSTPERVRSWLAGLAALVPAKAAVGGFAGAAVLTASAAVMVAGSTGAGEDKVPAEDHRVHAHASLDAYPSPHSSTRRAGCGMEPGTGVPPGLQRRGLGALGSGRTVGGSPGRSCSPAAITSLDRGTRLFRSSNRPTATLTGLPTPEPRRTSGRSPGASPASRSAMARRPRWRSKSWWRTVTRLQRWAAARVAIRTPAGQTIAGRSDFRSKAIAGAIREATEPTGPTVRVAWLNGHAGGESLGIYPTSTGRWCAVHLDDDGRSSLRSCYLSPERPGGGPVGLNGGLGTIAGPSGSRNIVQVAAEEPITRIEVRYPDGQAVPIDLSPAPPETGLPWAFAYFTVERVSEGFTVVGLDPTGNELARFEQTPPGIAPPLPTGP